MARVDSFDQADNQNFRNIWLMVKNEAEYIAEKFRRAENVSYNPKKAGLNSDKTFAIMSEYILNSESSYKTLSEKYGVSKAVISYVLSFIAPHINKKIAKMIFHRMWENHEQIARTNSISSTNKKYFIKKSVDFFRKLRIFLGEVTAKDPAAIVREILKNIRKFFEDFGFGFDDPIIV